MKSLKHLIEFIRDISKRVNTKQVLKDYDFCSSIQAAMMVNVSSKWILSDGFFLTPKFSFIFQTLENTTDSHIAIHVNALFEIVKIVTLAKSRNCCFK